MKNLIITGILLTAGCLNIFAQKIKTVEGRYEYYLPRHMSRAQGEQTALERAMIEAIADEFGTYVSQQTQLNLSSSKEGENTEFYSYGSTMVKGEWVETLAEPVFGIFLTPENEIVITCEVKGKAREKRRVVDDFDMAVLNGGTTDEYRSSTFIDGENVYLAFTSPVNGFVAVYLEDDSKTFARMLPFNGEGNKARKVDGNKRYVFFTRNEGLEQRYRLQTNRASERNMIHVLFSPNPFVLPSDHTGEGENALDELSGEKFRIWLEKSRSLDPEMQWQYQGVNIVERQD